MRLTSAILVHIKKKLMGFVSLEMLMVAVYTIPLTVSVGSQSI